MVTWPFMMASSGAYRIPRWEGFVILADTDWQVDLAGEGTEECSLSLIFFFFFIPLGGINCQISFLTDLVSNRTVRQS